MAAEISIFGPMFKIGVMASGGGSNFKAIIEHIGEGDLEAQCKFLITNNANCGAAAHAEEYGIPVYHISGKTHPVAADYEAAMMEVLSGSTTRSRFRIVAFIFSCTLWCKVTCFNSEYKIRPVDFRPSRIEVVVLRQAVFPPPLPA